MISIYSTLKLLRVTKIISRISSELKRKYIQHTLLSKQNVFQRDRLRDDPDKPALMNYGQLGTSTECTQGQDVMFAHCLYKLFSLFQLPRYDTYSLCQCTNNITTCRLYFKTISRVHISNLVCCLLGRCCSLGWSESQCSCDQLCCGQF